MLPGNSLLHPNTAELQVFHTRISLNFYKCVFIPLVHGSSLSLVSSTSSVYSTVSFQVLLKQKFSFFGSCKDQIVKKMYANVQVR